MTTTFDGPFTNWKNTSNKCEGYQCEEILAKVLKTSLEVQKGVFAYERDSIGFTERSYNWPLLANLLCEALRNKGKLSVLDFGGALGSSYFQHLPMLSDCNLSWHIVEQKHFVEAGKKYFESKSLHFHDSIEECISRIKIDCILLSSVMQYLDSPSLIIDKILSIDAEKIFVDKTITNDSGKNRIYIQKVSPAIYSASYPCRSFSEKWLIGSFLDHYNIKTKFNSLPFEELKFIDSNFRGYIFQKRYD
tara:strand:+ start:5174 stop:5917 length:744 start_codon:yes stop_codon:yes gene_type:complete